MDHHAHTVAGLGEAAHFIGGHTLLDALEDVVIARLVTHEEEPQTAILEEPDGVFIEVGPAVAAPSQTQRGELLGDLAGPRQVGREGIVIKEELPDLREELLHVRHLSGDILGRTHPVLVAANGLRPQTERALSRATPTRVHRNVRVHQVADEVLLDLQIPLVDIGHPGQRVHVVDEIPLRVVDDLAFLAETQTRNGFHRAVFTDLLAGEVELLATHPINRRGRLERLGRQDSRVRPNESDLRVRALSLDGLGHLAVVLQRRRGRIDDDVAEVLGDAQGLLHADVMGRTVEQSGIRHQGGRLGQPSWVPEGSHLTACLIAGTGAAIEAIKRGRG